MLEEAEAREQILQEVTPGKTLDCPLDQCLGHYLSRDLIATVDLPGFDNSQMDGYAVRAEDAAAGAVLELAGEQPAGPYRGLVLQSGQAIRIFTGAPIPEGADAVVMQEDVERESDEGSRIRIMDPSEPGEFIRRKGSDLCQGQRILEKGQLLNAARLGVAASQGWTELPVHERPTAAVISTGDELVAAGQALGSGQIYNSNGAMLEALATQHGVRVTARLHAADDPAHLKSILEEALDHARFCIVAGGVSVGEHDHVKSVLGELGMETGFWKVRIKPGKPLLFGSRGERVIFGLPGNPVSAHITFHLFVLPALLKAAGAQPSGLSLPCLESKLAADIANPGNRPHYLRMVHEARSGELRPAGLQQSHALFSLSQANALVRLDADQHLEAGSTVRCWLL